MTLAAGTRLGAYEILALLGAGGMGEVYRARDLRLDRLVAIKLLSGVSVDATSERLRHEARAAAALNHPNICTIHEIDEADNRLFIVMELVDGRPLSDLAHPMPVASAIRYGIQIAGALSHAHERGVVHRDLKSANLMITTDDRIKVLDFGIARRTEATGADTPTRIATISTGTIAGTPAYMAPELLRGVPADRRSDIWALGIVLYEMVSGRRPFGGETSFEVTSAILRDDPPRLPSRVPAAFRAVVDRCLAKEPGARYQHAGEVRAALETMATAAGAVTGRTRPARPSKSRAAGRPRVRAIAVLPLQNLPRDPEQEYFADGMTEALIAELAQIGSLRVISRSSAMRYKGTDKPVDRIGRELSLDAVVEGSVRRAGDQIRVTLELIHVGTDTHLWARSYDRDVTNVLQLQREIAGAVAEEIQAALTPGEKARLGAARFVDPAAYDAYLRGRHHVRQLDDESMRAAIAQFARAIEIQPDFAPAHAGLAEAHHWRSQFGTVEAQESAATARAAARRALTLDAALPDAHLSLALIAMFHDWDWNAASTHFQRAIELKPGSAEARMWYGWYLSCVEHRHDVALTEIEQAGRLDPHHAPTTCYHGFVHLFAGDVERALGQFQAAVAMEPRFWLAHFGVGTVESVRGRSVEAVAGFEAALACNPGAAVAIGGLGRACAIAGQSARANELLADLRSRAEQGVSCGVSIATIYAGLGDLDEAFRWLDRARQQREGDLIYVTCAPGYERLRSDPRYAEFISRMGLLQYAATPAPSPGHRPADATQARIQRLAVLPLANLSRDPDQEYFADGMTDALIAELAQIQGLRVISRTSVMRFKGTVTPLPEIARALGVDAVVEGSVLRSGDTVRITAQLIHAPTDSHLWARSYERRIADVLALQGEVARAISMEIRGAASGEPPPPVHAPRAVDPRAYTEYLKGRYRWRRLTEPDIRRALEHFQAALAIDPTYGPAHAGTATCHMGLAWNGAAPPREAFVRSRAAARQALDLDDRLSEAYSVLGYVAMYDWDWEAAQRELQRAIALEPGSPDARLFHSFYLTARGRHDEALAELGRAQELDPLSPLIAANLGYQSYFARRFDFARKSCGEAFDLDPAFYIAHWVSGIVSTGEGRYAEAVSDIEQAAQTSPGVVVLGWLGYAYTRAGREREARDVLSRLAAMSPEWTARLPEMARIQVGLGEHDTALATLEDACEVHAMGMQYLAVDPSMDTLAGDPRFQAVVRRMNLIAP